MWAPTPYKQPKDYTVQRTTVAAGPRSGGITARALETNVSPLSDAMIIESNRIWRDEGLMYKQIIFNDDMNLVHK